MNRKQLFKIIITIISIIRKSDGYGPIISKAKIKQSPYIILLIVLLIILKFLLVVEFLFLSIKIEPIKQAIQIKLKIIETIIIVVICVLLFLTFVYNLLIIL